MAKAVKAQKTIDAWKAKKWHKIVATKLFQEQLLGETPALEPNMLVGRTVNSNLMILQKDFKRQHVEIMFEVMDVKGDTAYTRIKKYEISPSYVKKTVRRERNRIDDSFAATTLDGMHIRLKPLLLTRFLVKNSVATALRSKARSYILKIVPTQTYDSLVEDLVSYKIQKALWEELKKIYPLRTCEIRVMEVEKKGAKESTSEAAVSPAQEIPVGTEAA